MIANATPDLCVGQPEIDENGLTRRAVIGVFHDVVQHLAQNDLRVGDPVFRNVAIAQMLHDRVKGASHLGRLRQQ
nr:hypothetical protein [Roseibacterium elongatum]